MPQAIQCFLECIDFEDAIRNAVSLGGDGDTQAAIAGEIAEAYYGVQKELLDRAFGIMDARIKGYFEKYIRPFYGVE